jgi:23S rRNA (adenine2030-N6)-methyltransferase
VAWYPIKAAPPSGHSTLPCANPASATSSPRTAHRREPLDAARLNGCGLVVVNPPFGFEEAARPILAALHGALATGEGGGGWTLERLADE